jgi:hypothetical protein
MKARIPFGIVPPAMLRPVEGCCFASGGLWGEGRTHMAMSTATVKDGAPSQQRLSLPWLFPGWDARDGPHRRLSDEHSMREAG